MKTSKQVPSDFSSSRRAQPLRQTRTNPPRSSISGARPFGPRGSISGGLEKEDIEIFPAITHFADVITALPKELVRHFTLLKEVDAKIFAPEEDLGKLVDAALNAPLPQRPRPAEAHHALGPTSAPMSAQNSLNGSIINGHLGSVNSAPDAVDVYNPASMAWDPANLPRRQLFQHCAYTMQNMLVSLDEKNHVISTAAEALNKQLARIDDCFPYIEREVSDEAMYGSTTHWAYPENRTGKVTGSGSRREIAAVNHIAAAAHAAEEIAARSDARKQAVAERKKGKNQPIESDFDDHHENRNKEKKVHGNSKIRKQAEASLGVGLGITNGAGTNGNPPKRRKVEKGPVGGAVMERPMSSVFGINGTATKAKAAGSPRETPGPEGPKKRSRAAPATNGQTRKRNNTVTSVMSPSIASSPIRSTFPESKAPKDTPPPTNGRPASSRARQNSTQSIVEKPPTTASSRQNGTVAGTPDLAAAAIVTGRNIPEVKVAMKETGTTVKGEHMLEDVVQDDSGMVGGLLVGNRKDSTAKQEPDTNGDAMQGIQTTIITTKSGRASKPSTPAIPSFPEPARSRSSRNAIEAASNNKRSHKKGAGAAAQLIAQQNSEVDDTGSNVQDDDEEDREGDDDEPRYCFCNGFSYGEMVGCDADGCEREWFHLDCVGLKVAPKGNAKWYCEDCKKKMNKRFNGR